MWTDFHFLRPFWLLALLPAAVLLFLLIKNKFQRGDWANVCDAELLPFILQEQPTHNQPAGWIATGLSILLCILALAGPTWERLPGPAFRNDSALVIALDLSKSMDATDIKPSRISRARYKISDILKQRKDGQTALLVYSGDAFTVTPLTTDTATIISQLEALNTDIMPSPGSNTTIGIEKAVDLLRQAGLAKGHILLVADGADEDSASGLNSILGDYRLSVLAVGTNEGAPIPQPGGGFVKDQQGNMVVAKLDVATLSELANAGHGIFQAVTDTDDDVMHLGDLFNSHTVADDKAEQTDILLEQWDEKGPWLLLLVLPWAALRFRKGLLSLGLVFLLPFPQDASALEWQDLWQTQNQRAQQAFQQQQYEQAADTFNNPEWRAAAQYKAGQYQEAAETLKDNQTADGHYNRGNALAKAGQLQEAVKAYQQALKTDPNHADAKHNKELVEKQLQEQEKQKDQDQQSSDQQDQKQDQKQQSSDQSKQQDENQPQNPNQDQQQQDQKQADNAQQQPEKQPPAENKDQKQENPPPKPEDAKSDEAKPDQPQQHQQAQPATPEQQETQRANEQLLKRIPDQPTGLLKRKFKYQYGQRQPPPHDGPEW
jgi:Ca-activated chloride channel family protein